MAEQLDAAGAQERAERTAAALHYLGPEAGTGATVWARAAQDELFRHEEARQLVSKGGAGLETWERLYGTVFLVVFAIHQVLEFAERVRSITGDTELEKARQRFDAVGPDAKNLRHLVVHLDRYAVGQGNRQTGKARPPVEEKNVAAQIYWYSESVRGAGCTVLHLGDDHLDLRAAAEAAV
jgi:hypothetical protein